MMAAQDPDMALASSPLAAMETLHCTAADPSDPGFEWTRLNGRDAATLEWLAQQDDVPELVRDALISMETRPRYEPIDGGVLLNLRAPVLEPVPDQDALVSIRMWLTRTRAITVTLRPAEVMEAMVARFRDGHHRDAGDLVAGFASLISESLDADIAELGDTLDELELGMESEPLYLHRHKVSKIRSEAIEFRRFIAPQFHALERFSTTGPGWLEPEDVLQLRNAADRFARMAEELEAIRERSQLMREELTDRRAELMDTRGLLISIVALIFLPLTFLTGLLGMNVAGIPFAHAPWAFWGVVLFCIAISAMMAIYFVQTRWTRS
jgi:zinc transporter